MHGGGQKRRLAHPQHVRNDERQHVAMDVSERIRRIDRLDLATAVCRSECARTIDVYVADFKGLYTPLVGVTRLFIASLHVPIRIPVLQLYENGGHYE